MKRLITILLTLLFVFASFGQNIFTYGSKVLTYDSKILHNSNGNGATFESSWKTDNAGTSDDDEITLPIYNGGTYDFNVNWGDGNDDDITAWDDAAVTHTYAGAGTYTVKITGTLNGWRFANGGDKLKILTISSWGDLLLGDLNSYFRGCTNLTISATDVLDVSGITNFGHGFRGCASLTTLDVSGWDVSNVIYFHYTFVGCTGLTTLDVSSWNVSNVALFTETFSGCTGLTTLDVSSWNTSSATACNYTFYNCSSLTTLAANNWNITSVTDMTGMFQLTTLSTASYDAILIGWEGQAVQNNVTFHGGNSKYTGGGAAEAARTALIDDHTWAITDGGTV